MLSYVLKSFLGLRNALSEHSDSGSPEKKQEVERREGRSSSPLRFNPMPEVRDPRREMSEALGKMAFKGSASEREESEGVGKTDEEMKRSEKGRSVVRRESGDKVELASDIDPNDLKFTEEEEALNLSSLKAGLHKM